MRDLSNVRMSPTKPWPSSPMRFASGTNTSSRNSSALTIPRSPSLRIGSPNATPSSPRPITNAVIPLRARAGLGLGEDDVVLGDAAVRDPGLLPAQPVAALDARRERRHAGGVRAVVGLGRRERGERRAIAAERAQQALPSAPRCRARGSDRRRSRPRSRARRARRRPTRAPRRSGSRSRGCRCRRRRRPPGACTTSAPARPPCARRSICGCMSASSTARAIGRSSRSANSCASAAKSRCSSLMLKLMPGTAGLAWLITERSFSLP